MQPPPKRQDGNHAAAPKFRHRRHRPIPPPPLRQLRLRPEQLDFSFGHLTRLASSQAARFSETR